jgi:hypothetical protein
MSLTPPTVKSGRRSRRATPSPVTYLEEVPYDVRAVGRPELVGVFDRERELAALGQQLADAREFEDVEYAGRHRTALSAGP